MIHAAGVCVATTVDDDEDEDALLPPFSHPSRDA